MLSRINRALPGLQAEEGQALAEYGLILALIAALAIAALGFLGVAIAGQLGAVTSAF